MIVVLLNTYLLLLFILVKLRIVPFNLFWKVSPIIVALLLLVTAKANVPLKAGDVLFKIDPVPFESQVKALEAQLKDGKAYDGSKTYRLNVPANVPVDQYWSLTAYDRETHALIKNVDRASRASNNSEVKKNPDGSVDLHIGPDVAPSFYPLLSSFPAVVEPVWAGEAAGSGAVLFA